jgi:hypothetical protein
MMILFQCMIYWWKRATHSIERSRLFVDVPWLQDQPLTQLLAGVCGIFQSMVWPVFMACSARADVLLSPTKKSTARVKISSLLSRPYNSSFTLTQDKSLDWEIEKRQGIRDGQQFWLIETSMIRSCKIFARLTPRYTEYRRKTRLLCWSVRWTPPYLILRGSESH